MNTPVIKPQIFYDRFYLSVLTYGPGKLSLLAHHSNNPKCLDIIGGKSTDNAGESRWIIGHSYSYERYAFIWEGEHQGVYVVGDRSLYGAVGTSWKTASFIQWSQLDRITTSDVSALVPKAFARDHFSTLWAIPTDFKKPLPISTNPFLIYAYDFYVVVKTSGPGRLSLLCSESYDQISDIVGGKTSTDFFDELYWVVSFSYTYRKFAFIWEGSLEAEYYIGCSKMTGPVGSSWEKASFIDWFDPYSVKTKDVASVVEKAVNRDGKCCFWALPEKA